MTRKPRARKTREEVENETLRTQLEAHTEAAAVGEEALIPNKSSPRGTTMTRFEKLLAAAKASAAITHDPFLAGAVHEAEITDYSGAPLKFEAHAHVADPSATELGTTLHADIEIMAKAREIVAPTPPDFSYIDVGEAFVSYLRGEIDVERTLKILDNLAVDYDVARGTRT